MTGVLITERGIKDMHREKTTWGHSKKMAIGKPRRESSGETKSAVTFILDFHAAELWENKSLFKPQLLWYFAMAALTD